MGHVIIGSIVVACTLAIWFCIIWTGGTTRVPGRALFWRTPAGIYLRSWLFVAAGAATGLTIGVLWQFLGHLGVSAARAMGKTG